MSTREEFLDKAADLGLEFPKNIPTDRLEERVLEALEEATSPPKVDEPIPTEPPVAMAEAVEETPNDKRLTLLEKRRKLTADAKKAAFATRVVTLTNKDNRENDEMTTAYLSFENQYFGLSKLVPLDIPVELEQGLIDVAETTMITLHKAEIIKGKRTGNQVAVRVKKFAISYVDNGK